MDASQEERGGLRCKSGDVARIVYSRTPGLKGKRVAVGEWCEEYSRWQVQLLDGPYLGLSVENRRPLLSTRCYFQDSSLEPIVPGRSEEDLALESISLQ